MVILEEPYISEMLINFLAENKVSVLENQFDKKQNKPDLHLKNEVDFVRQYQSSKKIYTVSEYALDWVVSHLSDTRLNEQIHLLKNKTAFRKAIRPLYPNFAFQEINYADLFTFDISQLQFPVVLKPEVGFLSAGVYTILDSNDWQNALDEISLNFKNLADKFPDVVVDDKNFILESYIGGKEFAIDVYFNQKEPVIINIFEHPFSSVKDVSDRLYITNKDIFDQYLKLFTEYISRLNTILDLDNIPVHIELRVEGSSIVPIEINPLRFTGLCLNEINYYVTGEHPLYYYLFDKTPDYTAMWEGKENDTFCFSILEKPENNLPTSVSVDTLKNTYSHILDWRAVDNPKLNIQAFVFSKTNDTKELNNILTLQV